RTRMRSMPCTARSWGCATPSCWTSPSRNAMLNRRGSYVLPVSSNGERHGPQEGLGLVCCRGLRLGRRCVPAWCDQLSDGLYRSSHVPQAGQEEEQIQCYWLTWQGAGRPLL